MEFKTIVYIVAGAIWLLSRFLQKREPEENQGKGAGLPAPSGESSPQPVRQGHSRKVPPRPTMTAQRQSRTSREFLPSSVSLEVPASTPASHVMAVPQVSAQEPAQGSVSPSDAELISDEIRNGRIDWRRSLIISELLGKRNGF